MILACWQRFAGQVACDDDVQEHKVVAIDCCVERCNGIVLFRVDTRVVWPSPSDACEDLLRCSEWPDTDAAIGPIFNAAAQGRAGA